MGISLFRAILYSVISISCFTKLHYGTSPGIEDDRTKESIPETIRCCYFVLFEWKYTIEVMLSDLALISFHSLKLSNQGVICSFVGLGIVDKFEMIYLMFPNSNTL